MDVCIYSSDFILLFFSEISNFLSDSECEHIKDLAKKNGLKESVAGFEEQVYNGEIEDALKQSGVLYTAKNATDLLQVATWALAVSLEAVAEIQFKRWGGGGKAFRISDKFVLILHSFFLF